MGKKKKSTLSQKQMPVLFYYISAIMAFLPLIVRIKQVNYDMSAFTWDIGQSMYFDVYSKFKAELLVAILIINMCILIYGVFTEKIKIHFKDPVFIIIVLMAANNLLASLFALNSHLAFWGYLERYEGFWVILSYLTLFLLTYLIHWKEINYKKAFHLFWIGNIILNLIGLFQYLGYDLLLSELIRPLITAFNLQNLTLNIGSSITYTAITQTLYHYNYVAFFISLTLPIFLSMMLYERTLKLKVAYALTSLLVLFNLYGSTARSGLVGLGIGLILWVILNRHKVFSNKRVSFIAFAALILITVGFDLVSGGFLSMRIKSAFNTPDTSNQYSDVYIADDSIIVEFTDETTLEIKVTSHEDNSQWQFDSIYNGTSIDPAGINDLGHIYYTQESLSDIGLFYSKNKEERYLLTLSLNDTTFYFDYVNDTLLFYNTYGNYVALPKTQRLGFVGKEKLGSGRGYIWSRTIPLILSRPLLGYGPDNFVTAFPQEDYIGKKITYNLTNMIVDKSHNIYLQLAINAGLPNLILFLTLVGLMVYNVIKSIKNNYYTFRNPIESGLVIGIISFLIAGFFNDFSVHTAPVFWICFGLIFSYYKNTNTQS